ncbi:hypothetical protein Tco_1565182 [Tanacetum coccineum]
MRGEDGGGFGEMWRLSDGDDGGGCSNDGDEDEVVDSGGHDGGDGCDDGVGMKVVYRLWWRRKWPKSGREYGRRRKIFREGGEVCVGG